MSAAQTKMATRSCLSAFLLLLVALEFNIVMGVTLPQCRPIVATDTDLIQFALNLEFLEAEFFLFGALGRGLDDFAPSLAQGGPPPVGGRIADLDPLIRRIIQEFGYQEIGHIRAITQSVGGIPRPQLNLSDESFAAIMNRAMNTTLNPPFNPYANSINYLLASYVIPYVGLVGYVGTIPDLTRRTSRSLVASLLGVEAGQDAVIRGLLYERANETVRPYGMTVADFTNRISELRNRLGMCGVKDEGLIVPVQLGAENRTTSNILSADANSLSYSRTPPEILRIIYGTGSERSPGGFFPNGGSGKIAMRLLR
ncbi:Desiccation-related protein PCC13-62 [Hibiscus syriacus]|uniref:Desiccation-related protein PCC13-62 n=1 Tax=Hibiscus syriacus TaxID=106335 RepID=A0A6A2YQS9_HIBSY|nr:desiccation-related protein PCC13-62-like [Hibiscus syriacus]KAE8681617.1 Desiccation-related protein PCC13-62 [Hibiscus syriacus]